jgi:hypothetical protein
MKCKAVPVGGRARWRPLRRDGRLAAVLAVLIALTAACGSGPSQQSQRLGVALTRCMRAHGVRSFPDVTVTASNGNMNIDPSGGSLVYFQSPAVRAGLRACREAVDRAGADQRNAG